MMVTIYLVFYVSGGLCISTFKKEEAIEKARLIGGFVVPLVARTPEEL